MLLPAFTDPVQRVLCVVAHPDDMEYGASAAVRHWTRSGVEVAYLLMTSGEAGMQRPPEEVGPLRAREQQTACTLVGVSDLTILDHPDGTLVYGLDLRRDIARRIREFRPDVVVTANFEVEAYGGYNQADHRAVGLSVVDGIRDADNAWVFPELAKDDLAAWGATWLFVAGHPDATHVIPVEPEDVAASVASLEAHQAYLGDLPHHPRPDEFIPEVLRQGGEASGHDAAVAFKVTRMGGIGGS